MRRRTSFFPASWHLSRLQSRQVVDWRWKQLLSVRKSATGTPSNPVRRKCCYNWKNIKLSFVYRTIDVSSNCNMVAPSATTKGLSFSICWRRETVQSSGKWLHRKITLQPHTKNQSRVKSCPQNSFFGLSGVVTKIYSAMSFNGLSVFSPFFYFFNYPGQLHGTVFGLAELCWGFCVPAVMIFSLCMHRDYLFHECLHLFGYGFGFCVDADFSRPPKGLNALSKCAWVPEINFFRRIP